MACSRETGGATVGRGRRPDRRGVAAVEGVWEVLFGRRGTPGCLGRCLLGIRSTRSRFYPGHQWNRRSCRAGPSGAQAAPRPRSIRCPSLLSLRQTGGFLSFGRRRRGKGTFLCECEDMVDLWIIRRGSVIRHLPSRSFSSTLFLPLSSSSLLLSSSSTLFLGSHVILFSFFKRLRAFANHVDTWVRVIFVMMASMIFSPFVG